MTPLSFENLALTELELKWPLINKWSMNHFQLPASPFPKVQCVKGGLEVELPRATGFLCNFLLKIPNRILLRLDHFKARDFPKLFQKIRKFPWREFLMGQIPNVECSSHQSRLFHSGRIQDTVIKALQAYEKANPYKQEFSSQIPSLPPTSLYLRFEKDECTLSIDTSGERLHKRSLQKKVGMAPLRENLAAGLLLSLSQLRGDFHGHPILIDPMCGSGTFLFEAADFFCPAQRDFSFLHFPGLLPWRKKFLPLHLQQEETTATMADEMRGLHFESYWGFDRDIKMVQVGKDNIQFLSSSPQMTFLPHDLFEGQDSPLPAPANGPKWVVLNPPYGKRIKLQKSFKDVSKQIITKFDPEVIGMVIPADEYYGPEWRGWERKLTFLHGGIKVHWIVWTRHPTSTRLSPDY